MEWKQKAFWQARPTPDEQAVGGEEVEMKDQCVECLSEPADASGFRRAPVFCCSRHQCGTCKRLRQGCSAETVERCFKNVQALFDARQRAEQSRIKLGIAALFGLRNV